MTIHKEKRIVPHLPENLYALVADVGKYPEFLPWCIGARVREQSTTAMRADMIIGFKLYRERFTSQVALNPDALTIEARYVDGPFKHMRNTWQFNPHKAGCEIDFFVEFEFNSVMFQTIIETLFGEAVRRMVHAFEARADDLYERVAPPE